MKNAFFSKENYLDAVPILEMQFILKDNCNVFNNEEHFNLKTDFLNVNLFNVDIVSTISQVHKTEYDNVFLFYYSINIGKFLDPDLVTNKAIKDFIREVNKKIRDIFEIFVFIGVFDIYQGFEDGIEPCSTFSIQYNDEKLHFALTPKKRINKKWKKLIKDISQKVYGKYPYILKNENYNWL